MVIFSVRFLKRFAAFAGCAALGLLAASPAHADSSPAHPCGAIDWLDELRVLSADLEAERGREATRTLFDDTLVAMLPEVDVRLHAQPDKNSPTWRVQWGTQPATEVAVSDDVRDRYRAVLAPACTLMRQHAPELAQRRLSGAWRDLWIDFEKVFIAQLKDPAAAFGYSDISLSIDSPSTKPANEATSLQWMDRSFGLARYYLSDLHNYHEDVGKNLVKLRAEAPLKTLILDLRGSGGGDFSTLEALLARFLPTGTLANTVRNRQGQEKEIRVKENPPPDADREMPLIVLTSRETRGGAELLAGTLQANRRAIVIGEPTAGLAGHRRLIKLAKDNTLILTDSLPRFPGQTDTVTRIEPDVPVPAALAIEAALTRLAENGRTPANPFIRPDEQRHPLVRAVLERNNDEALRLIESGAELEVEASREALGRVMPAHFRPRGNGATPVLGYPLAIAAAAQGKPKVLAAIGQRAPAALHRTDTDGRTALAYAAMASFPNTTRVLLDHGLDPLHPAKNYPISESPLALAVQLNNAEVVAIMMAAIPRERLNHTAVLESVWITAGKNDLPTLTALLEGGASPHYIARQGGTALIEAVLHRNPDVARLLLKHGATVDDHPYRGLSIVQQAEKQAADGDAKALEVLSLIRQAPRLDRQWQKSKETEAFEGLMRMIDNPKNPEGKPKP
jgi:ankyrin repeat protein